MLKTAFSALVIAAIFIALAGCNTVQGVGKDVSSAGRVIERSSGK